METPKENQIEAMPDNPGTKKSLETEIKIVRVRFCITKSVTYISGALSAYLAGAGVYNLTEGDYKQALMNAGFAIYCGLIGYNSYKTGKERQEKLRNIKSQLENLVAE